MSYLTTHTTMAGTERRLVFDKRETATLRRAAAIGAQARAAFHAEAGGTAEAEGDPVDDVLAGIEHLTADLSSSGQGANYYLVVGWSDKTSMDVWAG